MVSVDRKTGAVSTEDGWKLVFHGNEILLAKDAINLSVSYEPMVGGTKIAIYDDLEMRGIERQLAQTAITVIKNALVEMGFTVTVQ